MPHELKLTKGAALLCRNTLSLPGALTKPDELWWAGLLLTAILSAEKMPESVEEQDAWCAADGVCAEVTEGQRETIKKAMSYAIAKGELRPSVYANELLTFTGLAPS